MVAEHDEYRPTRVDWGERLVAAVFCLLGVGILLPWNAFISAKHYFQARMCDGSASEQPNVELWFGLVFNIASVSSLGLILLVQYIRDERHAKRREQQGTELLTEDSTKESSSAVTASQADRLVNLETSSRSYPCISHGFFMVVVPLSVYLTVFLLTTLLVLFPNVSPSTFLPLTLVGLALCGMSCAIAGAGITASASMFAHKIGINSYFSGQAVGGVAVSVANLLAATLEDPNTFWKEQCHDDERVLEGNGQSSNGAASCDPYHQVDWSTFLYFAVGCATLGACIVGYMYIERSAVASQLREEERIRRTLLHPAEENEPLETSIKSGIELQAHDSSKRAESGETPRGDWTHALYQESGPRDNDDFLDECDKNTDMPEAVGRSHLLEEEGTTMSVLAVVSGPALAIWLTFFVTLAIFPSWTSRLESARKCQSHLRLHNDLFMPMTFVIFNVGDLTGRLLSAKVKVEEIHHLSRKLVLAALARFLFGPLFLLCLASGSAFNQIAVSFDAISVLVQFLFAFTNGMAVSVSFMHAPSLIPASASVQEMSATLLNFCLVFGLLSGALFSFPFSQIATGHW